MFASLASRLNNTRISLKVFIAPALITAFMLGTAAVSHHGAGEQRAALGQIAGTTIREINEIATTIASAVEEQGAATKEIARNVQQAAAGTNEVSTNIVGVTKASSETGATADQVLNAAQKMARQTDLLRGEVERFLGEVKAA